MKYAIKVISMGIAIQLIPLTLYSLMLKLSGESYVGLADNLKISVLFAIGAYVIICNLNSLID